MSDIENDLFIMLDNCERSIRALKAVVEKVVNGETVPDDVLAQLYDDALFQESYSDRKDDSITEIGIVIEHLLKLRYSTTSRNIKVWINSINTHRGTLYGYTRWLTKNKKSKLIKYIIENMDDAYEFGVALYKRDVKKYTDLQYRMNEIPEECPWTFDEIMDLDPEELISDKFFKDGGENDG